MVHVAKLNGAFREAVMALGTTPTLSSAKSLLFEDFYVAMPFVDLFTIPEREVYVRSESKLAASSLLALLVRAAKSLLQIGMTLSFPSMFCYSWVDELACSFHARSYCCNVIVLYKKTKTRTCLYGEVPSVLFTVFSVQHVQCCVLS